MPVKISFPKTTGPDFYTTLNKKVEDFFESGKISKKGNGLMLFKLIFYPTVFIAAYLVLVLTNAPLLVQFLLWSILGLFTAFIGLNIAHDAVHGSISGNKTVNKILGYSFNIIGANSYVWNITHNIVHHTYTNIEGHDEDIVSIPILRMCPHQKLRKIHKHQYWYAFIFYSLASLSWVFIKDYVKFFKKKIGNYNNKTHPQKEYFILFISKAIYYVLFLVIPFVFIQALWWQILLGFIVMHIVQGTTMAMIFMLAHVVEETDFPMPNDTGNMENTWAVHQLYTTADFGRNNDILNFFCGGLNFQVEHHLYPKICHVHYKSISEIVKNTAAEFNLRYNDNASFTSAVGSHIRLLKSLGRPAVIVAGQ
ncbi:MAG: acyl-CoA desaturase [Chitinophagaceae bacterium]